MSGHVRTVRLKVLMHHFYAEGDHRQKALVILQKSWTTVLQLQQHIQRIFRLPSNIYLTVADGCLLPTDEDISVISETDSVTVQPVKNTFAQLSDAFSQAHIYSANETTPGAWTSDVSSPGIDVGSRAEPGTKRPKTEPSSSTTTTSTATATPTKLSKWIKDVNSLDVLKDEKSDDEPIPPVIPVKAKRQRKRKRKQPQPPELLRSDSADSVIKTEQTMLDKPTVVFRAEHSNRIKGHIRFGGSDDNTAAVEAPRKAAAPANEPFPLPRAARVIRGIIACTASPATSSTTTSATTPTTSRLLTPKPVQSSAASRPVVTTTVTTTVAAVDAPMQVLIAKATPSDTALETLRRSVPDLQLRAANGPLQEKDMIAFRIMKLSENYMPGMSEYIIGMVQAVAADGGTVSVHIMAGWEQTLEPQGKFSLTANADVDGVGEPAEASSDRSYQVQRAEMYDVKYVQL